jgi:PemK-like protein.
MDISKDVIIGFYDNKDWKVWHITDPSLVGKQKEHFYIVVPLTDNKFILLCLITSQGENKKRFYDSNPLINYLIKTNKKELDCLNKDSFIDCNQPQFISKTDLKNKISELKVIDTVISKSLKSKILTSLKKSPAVKPFVKDSINTYIK